MPSLFCGRTEARQPACLGLAAKPVAKQSNPPSSSIKLFNSSSDKAFHHSSYPTKGFLLLTFYLVGRCAFSFHSLALCHHSYIRFLRLPPAVLSTAMDTSQAKPTAEQVKEWNEDKLLDWINKKLPKPLKDDTIKKFKKAEISGRAFLTLAGNVEFFKNEFNLPIGPSLALADLAREAAGTVPHLEKDVASMLEGLASLKRQLEEEKKGSDEDASTGKLRTFGTGPRY